MSESRDIAKRAQSSERPDLLRHLDSLYALAQAVTLDEARAARLVSETYRQAFEQLEEGYTPGDPKEWLSGLLLSRIQETAVEEASHPWSGEGEQVVEPEYSLRQRLAEQVMARTFPVALAALPDNLRIVLVLEYLEKTSRHRLSEILGISEESIPLTLEMAEDQLEAALHSACSGLEWKLLRTIFYEGWIQAWLKQVVRAEFSPAPSTLRAAIERENAWPQEPAGYLPAKGSSFRRSGSRQPPWAGRSSTFQGMMVAVLLVCGAGILGVLITHFIERDTGTSLIALMADEAGDVTLTLETESPERAEEFVWEQLGFRLTLPDIDQTELAGVGISELAPDVRVPAFVFSDAVSGESLVVYVCNYAMMDRFKGKAVLESSTLIQIEDDEHFDVHDLGEEKVLIWRNRDDIFIAVTPGDPHFLQERIFPAS